jgi:uncharacterized coiled-coil protein SlyX
MTTATHEARISSLETRMTATEENVTALTDTVYKMHRRVVGLEINMSSLMDHFGLPKASQAEVDAILEAG